MPSIYCPDATGHATELAQRMVRIFSPGKPWQWHVRPETAMRESEWLHLAELKHAVEIACHLPSFTGALSVMACHPLPHVCSPRRRRAVLEIYARACCIFVPNHGTSYALSQLGVNPERIKVLAGYPAGRLLRRLGSQPPSRPKQPLALGYFHTSKGVDRMLALAKMLRRLHGSSLTMCGAMDPEVAMRARASGCRVVDRFVSRAEMERILRDSGCLIMPYRQRTDTPLVNRALEWGIPVLRTPEVLDWNGRRDAVGLELPWGEKLWAEAVIWLLEDMQNSRRQAMRQALASHQRVQKQLAAWQASMNRDLEMVEPEGARSLM